MISVIDGIGQPQAVVLAGLVGAGGALVGSISSLLWTTWWQAKHRWNVDRKQAYVEYGKAVKRLNYFAIRTAKGLGMLYDIDPISYDDGCTQMEQAERDRAEAWESVLLLGSEETVRIGQEWHRKVWQIRGLVQRKHVDDDELCRLVADYESLRKEFYNKARRDLHVNMGIVNPVDPEDPPPDDR